MTDLILLEIRKKQILSELKKLGIYSLLIFALLGLLVYYSYKIYLVKPDAFFLTITLAFICFSIQSVRKDKQFIFLHVNNSHLNVYSEYFVLTFPFAVTSLLTLQWYCFPLLQLILFLIPLNKFTIRKKTFFRNISVIIPPANFEWISGFRKSFIYIIPLYLTALAFGWVKILPLFLLWCLTVTIVSFYNESEPVNVLREGNETPGNFLFKKIKRHSVYLIIFYLPVLIINSIFNVQYPELNLLFLLTQLALLSFGICFKYGNYTPNQILPANSVIVSIVSLTAAVPLFLPLPSVIAVKYYFKAKKNLNQYLND